MPSYFLKNAWYAPNGRYFEPARVFPVEIPEDLVPFLPKTAELAEPGASRARPQPAIMANIKTIGAPVVNSQTLFAAIQADKDASEAAERQTPKAVEPEPVSEPTPPEALAEQAAAEKFAQAQQEEQKAPVKANPVPGRRR